MVNLIGAERPWDPVAGLTGALGVRQAAVHLYGKDHRPGRKLGHVTATGRTPEAALLAALEAADAFGPR